ncbi:MAG: integrase core domain-containing protein, partial [Desulfomonilaceae bacterium]
ALASLCAFLRHSPKVGAVCGNSARTDLCGGRWVTGVPTATESMAEAREALNAYFEYYNCERRHQILDRRTPYDVYWSTLPKQRVAA